MQMDTIYTILNKPNLVTVNIKVTKTGFEKKNESKGL